MIRQIKQYLAIRSYVRRLSLELVRRFGKKPFYSIEQVTQAAERGGYSAAFVAYAHAVFCSEAAFNEHYKLKAISCSYSELRRTISRRYLKGQIEFDANTIRNRFRPNTNQGEFYESGIGEDYPKY